MMSDQEEPHTSVRTVSPRSAAEAERASRRFIRNLNEQKRRDEEERVEEGEEEDKRSESEYE